MTRPDTTAHTFVTTQMEGLPVNAFLVTFLTLRRGDVMQIPTKVTHVVKMTLLDAVKRPDV